MKHGLTDVELREALSMSQLQDEDVDGVTTINWPSPGPTKTHLEKNLGRYDNRQCSVIITLAICGLRY